MILLINTSSALCKISFVEDNQQIDNQWQADRKLAKELLGHLETLLEKHHKTWSDISAIGVFEGPGSFTGLRIGITVMNTMADAFKIPIVSASGDNWKEEVINKIKSNQDQKIVLPFYGSEAHITKPKK